MIYRLIMNSGVIQRVDFMTQSIAHKAIRSCCFLVMIISYFIGKTLYQMQFVNKYFTSSYKISLTYRIPLNIT